MRRGIADEQLEFGGEQVLHDLGAEYPLQRVGLGLAEEVDAVVEYGGQPLRAAGLDHAGVGVHAEDVVALVGEHPQHLAPTAADVDDRARLRRTRENVR